jgi:hypothetical protein
MPSIQSIKESVYQYVQIQRTLRRPIGTSRLGYLGVVAGMATTPLTVCLSRAHGVKAAINVNDFACCCRKPVRH